MVAARGIDELSRDTNLLASATNAALQNVTDAKFLRDRTYVW